MTKRLERARARGVLTMTIVTTGALMFACTIHPAFSEHIPENRNHIAMRYTSKVHVNFVSQNTELIAWSSDLSQSLKELVESRVRELNIKVIRSDLEHETPDARNLNLIVELKMGSDKKVVYEAQLVLEGIATIYGTSQRQLISVWQTEVTGECADDCSTSLRNAVAKLMDRFAYDYAHTKHLKPRS